MAPVPVHTASSMELRDQKSRRKRGHAQPPPPAPETSRAWARRRPAGCLPDQDQATSSRYHLRGSPQPPDRRHSTSQCPPADTLAGRVLLHPDDGPKCQAQDGEPAAQQSTVKASHSSTTTHKRRPGEGVVARVLKSAVLTYQSITTWRTPSCRFVPSCSDYALEALERFGARRGTALALRRLARCRPGGGFGPDPVPESQSPESRLTDPSDIREPA